MPLRLHVVIVSYRSSSTLPAAFRSLRLLQPYWDLHVTVHDNSEDAVTMNQARQMCLSLDIPIETYLCPTNCGFAAACNASVHTSSDDFILFLNPDAVIERWPSDWVPSPGIWGPTIRGADSHVHYLSARSRGLRDELLQMAQIPPRPAAGKGYVSGACLLIDQESFCTLRGFDERFFLYYEDIDLGIRATEAGIPVTQQRDWHVRHIGGVSASSSSETQDATIHASVDSSLYFHRKHGHRWELFGHTMRSYFRLRQWASSLRGDPSAAKRYRNWSSAYRDELTRLQKIDMTPPEC